LFFDHTPLYVYFVALLTAIGEPTVLIIRTATLVFGVLTILMVFRVGLVVRGLGSALVGSMLVALNPFFVTHSWFIRMEVPLCFFLVLALYLVIKERWLLAGLSIAVAVMLKEIALAFWLVAVAYVLVRRGPRAAAVVAVPTLVAFFAWLAYAASIGLDQLLATMGRWLGSAAGMPISDPRLHIGPLRWTGMLIGTVIGPVLIFASGAAVALASVSRKPVVPIVVVPLAYVAVAVVASYLIRLKEPRFVIAIIPMLALAIALVIDWGGIWADVRGRAPVDPLGTFGRWLVGGPQGSA
jgi:4-amino-4-deoxy-L-arabinose transferase-like glycosyltransferase